MMLEHTMTRTTRASLPGPIEGHSVDPMSDRAPDAQRECEFERAVLPLARQLLNAAMRLTRSAEDAEDLVQEVMLRAYAGFGSFQAGTSLKAWLYRILHNTWISEHRKKKCRPKEVSMESISGLQLPGVDLYVSNASRSAEDDALASMADEEITTAMAALRVDMRMAVYYADVLGFSCAEIAAMTDCPIGTVMSRLHRGRKRLRTSLIPAAHRRGLMPEQRYVTSPPAA